jgi:hypothetical protein
LLVLLVFVVGCRGTYQLYPADAEQIRTGELHTWDNERVFIDDEEDVRGQVRYAQRAAQVVGIDYRQHCRNAVMMPRARQESLEEAGWAFPDELSFKRDDVRVEVPVMRVRDRELGCVELRVDDVDHVQVVVGKNRVGGIVAVTVVGAAAVAGLGVMLVLLGTGMGSAH